MPGVQAQEGTLMTEALEIMAVLVIIVVLVFLFEGDPDVMDGLISWARYELAVPQ